MDAKSLNLRKHWKFLCVTTFLLYAAFLARYVSLYDLEAFSARLEVLMFLLSFPFGSLFMYIFYTGIGGITERILLWPIALGIGYFQWFHLLPLLAARRHTKVTTLNLLPVDKVASAPDKNAGLLPHFDVEGHTPLERLFVEESKSELDATVVSEQPSAVSANCQPEVKCRRDVSRSPAS